MIDWTRTRWASFILHLVFLSIPFVVSTVSAFLFWQSWFKSALPAVVIVGSVEILAVTGLIAHIRQLQWPLKGLRRLLPFISIVPVGWEVYLLLKPNGLGVALTFTIGLSGWLVYLAFVLYDSLERLFIDPIAAAREKSRQSVGALATSLAQFGELQDAVYGFAELVQQSKPQQAAFTASPVMFVGPSQLDDLNSNVQQPQQLLDTTDPTAPAQTYQCGRCGTQQYAAGRDPAKMHASSFKLGCLSCRDK